jgi:hypothetical protein
MGMKWTALSLVALLAVTGCRAQFSFQQQSSPLRGQGVPSTNVSEGIYVSVFLDRLLGVDERDYRFDAVLYAYVTWEDQRGIEEWFYNNIATNCADPSRSDYFPAWCNEFRALCQRFQNSTEGSAERAQIRDEGDYYLGAPIDLPCKTWNSDGSPARTSCNRYCSNTYNAGDCCDGIFIPDINVANIYSLDQDYVIASQLMPQYDYRKEHYGAWIWAVNFHAQFFIRMDFRAFPWDQQQLIIQLKYTHDGQDLNSTSVLVPSSAGVLSLRPNRNGDDSSGWKVDEVYMEPYIVQDESKLVRGKLIPPAVNDPVPLFTTATDANGVRYVTGLQEVFESRLNPGNSVLIIIKVSRYSSFFVVNNLVPIILSTALGFFVFLLDVEEMEKRLGLLVTLFLALTALQFVISTNLPNSSYVLKTQALVLAGYALFVAMALESWAVYYLGTSHQRHKRVRAWRRAYKQYIKGEITANDLAEASIRNMAPRKSSVTQPLSAGDVEDLEPPSLAHITGTGVQPNGDSDAHPADCQPSRPGRKPAMLKRLGGRRWRDALSPLKHDSDYAEWLSGKVDRYSLIFLVVAYILILIIVCAT